MSDHGLRARRALTAELSGIAIDVQTVERDDEFDALEPGWERLLAGAAHPNPCLSWRWCRLWWEIYRRDGDRLQLLCFRDDDELVGVLPLYVQAERRELRFLGTGEPEAAEVSSEFQDVLSAGYTPEVLEAAFTGWLEGGGHEWRTVRFERVTGRPVVDLALRHTHRAMIRKRDLGYRYTAMLPGSWEEYLEGRTARFRNRLRRARRLVAEDGWSSALVEAGEAAGAMTELTALHEAYWQARGRPGAFADERFREFHRRLLEDWLPAGRAWLLRLACDGRTAGVVYGFRAGAHWYYYQSGFDIETYGDDSPGVIAHADLIARAIDAGAASYDFMLGGKSSYKRYYAAAAAPVRQLDAAITARGRLALRLEAARERLAEMLGRRDPGAPAEGPGSF